MPKENIGNMVAKPHKQPRAMGADKPDTSNKPAEEKKVDLDWTYIEEGVRKHYQKSTTVESTGEEEKRKAKKHLA